MNIGKLLIDDRPLQVLPSLAEAIGLNEALVLQQIHWLLSHSKNTFEGKKWIYNTYDEWKEKYFRFFSISTIRRTIESLESRGLLISTTKFNKMKMDKTKWYTIDYNVLENIEIPSAQNEQSNCSNWTDVSAQNEQTNNHKNIQKTTTKDIKTSQKKTTIKFSDDDLKVSQWMFDLILKITPNKKKEDLSKWANCIRLMREVDGHTHHDICELFKFANSHDFWHTNILSPDKLRKHWDTLTAQKNARTFNQKGVCLDDNSNWGKGLTISVRGNAL